MRVEYDPNDFPRLPNRPAGKLCRHSSRFMVGNRIASVFWHRLAMAADLRSNMFIPVT